MNPPEVSVSTAPAVTAVSTDVLRFLFDFNHRALGLNVADLTHADSLVIAAPGTNCTNWMLGHVVSNRSAVLELLGAEPLWSEADSQPFCEGGAWADPPAQARPWASLLADFETTQERIRWALDTVTADHLAALHKPESRRPRGMQLHFLQFHEAYHVGQIGLMRRVVGKPGAI